MMSFAVQLVPKSVPFFREIVVFTYFVSIRRGDVSLARACLESLDTIALK